MSRAGDWAREALAGPGCWVYCSPLSRPVWVPADDSEHRNDCEMVQQASCICAAQRNREQQQDATPEPEPAAEHAHAAELERAAQPAYAAEHAHAASSIKAAKRPSTSSVEDEPARKKVASAPVDLMSESLREEHRRSRVGCEEEAGDSWSERLLSSSPTRNETSALNDQHAQPVPKHAPTSGGDIGPASPASSSGSGMEEYESIMDQLASVHSRSRECFPTLDLTHELKRLNQRASPSFWPRAAMPSGSAPSSPEQLKKELFCYRAMLARPDYRDYFSLSEIEEMQRLLVKEE